jgi:HK97 family phage major capsid protein/HK97 family phage prohead protease
LALLAHDKKKPLANSERGTLKFVDGRDGLTVTMSLDPNITWHADALQATRRGDFTGMSFGFGNATDRWRDENGTRIRELVSVDLREISPVVWAAYPSSTIATRSKYSTSKGSKSMSKIEMLTERKRVLDRMREIEPTIDTNTEARSEYETLDIEYERLSGEIAKTDRAEKMQQREWELSQSSRVPIRPTPDGQARHDERRETPKDREARSHDEWVTRALSLDGGSGDQAAYLVSETLQGKLIVKKDELSQILARCETMRIQKAAKVTFPTLESDPADPSWTQELNIGASDSTMDFQGRSLNPIPLSSYVKVSKKLVEASKENVSEVVMNRLAAKHAMVLENAALNGTGAGQPLGVMVNSAHGINTDRDVSTGNTTTSIKADNLIEVYYSIKPGYLQSKSAAWVFSRPGMKQIRTLKDGEGRYLYEPSLTAGTPAMLLGVPVLVSAYCPQTFTSGQYVGILGDWSYYVIAYALEAKFEVLRELFALTNQIAVTCRTEVDSMPVVSEAFSRVKLG